MALKHLIAVVGLSGCSGVLTAKAQSTSTGAACASRIAPQNGAPSVAPGFRVEVVANGLRDPRSIIFDREGGLLVVEQEHGVSRLTLSGDGTCAGDVQMVVEDDSVSACIVLSKMWLDRAGG